MTKTEKFLGKEEYRNWELNRLEGKVACLDCKFACFSIIHNINPVPVFHNDPFEKRVDNSRQLICECEGKFNSVKFDRIEIFDKDGRKSFFDKQKVISQCMKFTKDDEPELDID